MSAPVNGPKQDKPAPKARASRDGLWGALLGAGAAAAAFLALRPAPAGPLLDQPSGVPSSGGLDTPAGHRNGPPRNPNHVGHGSGGESDRQRNTEHAERRPASKRIIVGYGFWIFLLSDIIMFSAFFATYAVLVGETAGGPSGRDLFDLGNTAIETGCLLLSSFTCGLATVALNGRRHGYFYLAMAATGALGAAFIGLELHEFWTMVAGGNGPGRSAFLSAFFALVGLHGVHVSIGLLWLLTMMAQVWAKGDRPDILRRVMCFGLFWHALDIVWVGLFTVVYLMGVAA